LKNSKFQNFEKPKNSKFWKIQIFKILQNSKIENFENLKILQNLKYKIFKIFIKFQIIKF